MLGFYARHFGVVEINSTYYRVPNSAMIARMEQKTPAGFEFLVKAHGDMTHQGSRDAALFGSFLEAIEPLARAEKLRGVLGQFPWGFKYSPAGLDHLAFLRDALAPHPLFVEFRHASWMREPVFEFLQARAIGYCSVDEPPLHGLIPPVARATTPIGYVRFHGRNSANWWGRGEGDRYDYDYSEAELRDWVKKIRTLAERAERVYIFFNNCHAGHAAKNAQLMQRLLGEES
jgi:uncharacterized protein YecE (DUF72 family)